MGIWLSSLQAGAENQTCSSSTAGREGLACFGMRERFENCQHPGHRRKPGIWPGHTQPLFPEPVGVYGERGQATYVISGMAYRVQGRLLLCAEV